MENLKFETYTLPEYWAPALVNDDATGMDDLERAAMNEWLRDNDPGVCVHCDDASFFTERHDARGYALACDCLNFTFQKV